MFERNEKLTQMARAIEQDSTGEFDPGSERTLAACLTHASRAGEQSLAADGCVTRE